MISAKVMFRIAKALEAELIKACPVKTGRLKISINVIVTDRGLLITMASYGKYVEFGTNPYVIKIKDKKALANKKSGDVFGKKVNHPGIRPTYFVRNTILEKLPGIIERETAR